MGHDREHRLQELQASLYAEAQRLFAEQNCLVFPNRYDEYIIVSNGLNEVCHCNIQNTLNKKFDLDIQMNVGRGQTPAAADRAAHLARERNLYQFGAAGMDDVIIMHVDVDDLTSRTRQVPPYHISMIMMRLHLMMAQHFAERQSLSFFMGGDNFMVVASEEGRQDAKMFLDAVYDGMGIKLNCGIGRASNGRGAAMNATKALDSIREIRDSGSGTKPDIYEVDCC